MAPTTPWTADAVLVGLRGFYREIAGVGLLFPTVETGPPQIDDPRPSPGGTPMLYGFGRNRQAAAAQVAGFLIAAITRPPGAGRVRSMAT